MDWIPTDNVSGVRSFDLWLLIQCICLNEGSFAATNERLVMWKVERLDRYGTPCASNYVCRVISVSRKYD